MRRLAVLVFVSTAALLAQTNTGTITGTVMDQQQAAMNGVKVTATNTATDAVQVAITNTVGVYSIPALEPGVYNLTLEIAGFKKLHRGPMTVESSRTMALDFNMDVGSTLTEITVADEAPLVQQAAATIQYGVDLKQIDELPLANQSALQILALLPGVNGDPGVEQFATTTGLGAVGGGMSISGSPMGTVQYQADGVSNTSTYYGRISLSFSTDAVAEVSVLQNAYSAEYGRVGGGIVSMTTKSGTNKLHGTIFSFTQNDVLNAAPFTNSYRKKGMLRYWRGGFDIGGPVEIPKLYHGRSKTFFFVGFEPLRQYQQSSAFARVPTAAERNGDFSHSVYNTTSNQPVEIFQQFQTDPSGTGWTNQPIKPPANTAYPQFAGNIIPPSLVSPIGRKFLDLLPMPNMSLNGLGQNYSVFRTVRNIDNRYTAKVDQAVTGNNRLSFRISQAPVNGNRTFIPGLLDWVPTDQSIATNAVLSNTYIWGGNKVNELRVGFNRSKITRIENADQLAVNGFQQYGFPSNLTSGMPEVYTGDTYIQQMAGSPGSYQTDNSLSLTNIVSWTKGRHSLKMGFDFQAPQQNLMNYQDIAGVWQFSAAYTGIGAGNTAAVLGIPNAQTGFIFASMLAGFPSSAHISPAVTPYQYRWKYYAGFLQDDFKVSPRLTLNLGVRYQVEVPRSEKHHEQGYFVDKIIDLPAGGQQEGYIQLNGLGGASNTLWPTRYNNFEPRLGFAYRLPALIKGLKVLRGAYAIAHIPTNGLFSSPMPDIGPKAGYLSPNGAANGGQVQMDSFPLVLPGAGSALPSNGQLTDINGINSLFFLNPHVTIPYMQQWNLGLGFQFGNNYGLEVNYVGNKGTNLFGPSQVFNAINLPEYSAEYQAGLNMSQQVPNPAGIIGPNGKVTTITRQNSLRPLPLLGDIIDPLEQGFDSNYNALQMNLTKRFSHGFQFNVNYTWMKAMDDTSCSGQYCNTSSKDAQIQNWGTGWPQLYGDSHTLEKSISVSDIPSTLRFNYNWDLPFGHGKPLFGSAHGALNQIVGNWKWSGSGGVRSGFPMQALANTSAGFPDTVGQLRPNIVPGVNPVNPNWKDNCNNPVLQNCPYVNALAVFTPPSLLSLGNATRVLDNIRMPHVVTYNMAFIKEFPIHEQVRLSFRAEMYGALNHVYFSTNGNNFSLYQNLSYVGGTPAVTANNIKPAYGSMGASGNRTIQLGLKLYF